MTEAEAAKLLVGKTQTENLGIVIREAIKAAIQGPKGRIDALEQKIATLEARLASFDALERKVLALEARPSTVYKGVWDANTHYHQGHVVTDRGSMWHCDEKTLVRPGSNGRAWTLCVKHGRDGRDGRDTAAQ